MDPSTAATGRLGVTVWTPGRSTVTARHPSAKQGVGRNKPPPSEPKMTATVYAPAVDPVTRPSETTGSGMRRHYPGRRTTFAASATHNRQEEHGRHRGHRRPIPEPDPGGDDLRRLDDVHRPDHRLHRRARDPAGTGAECHRRTVGGERLPAVARRALRLRGPPGRHRGPPEDGRPRRRRLRRVVGLVRADAEGSSGRSVDRHVPGRPGCGWGDHVPRRPRHRRADFRPARAREGAGDLLRDRRRAHRRGADPGRLPDRVDVARHLLASG